jgi:hypothetical protein
MHRKKPLYRKVNTRARGVHHRIGGEYRWQRQAANAAESGGSMHGKKRRGLDYTPLFKFLLTRVGESWPETYSEAASRLDRLEPIFWIVARSEIERKPVVLLGENSYFSGLYIDENNRLALVDPAQSVETMKPSCACCTHTLNGVPFVQKYSGE